MKVSILCKLGHFGRRETRFAYHFCINRFRLSILLQIKGMYESVLL